MNKYSTVALVLLACLCLTACGKKAEFKRMKKTTQTTELVESGTQNEQTKSVEEENPEQAKEQYAVVFQDFETLLGKIRPNSGFSSEEVMDARNAMSIPVQDWVAESIWRNKDNLRYALYDIDGNGTSELLTATQNSDGTIALYGVYYINGTSPELLAEGFVGGTSARAGIIIYKDGSVLNTGWSSGTGIGGGSLYELQEDNTKAIEVQNESDFNVVQEDVHQIFGKTEADVLALETLEWQTFTSSELESSQSEEVRNEKMDPQAILAGDFSGIEGTWQSNGGSSFTISGQTISTSEGVYTITGTQERQGQVSWTVAEVRASPPVYILVPAGSKISTPVQEYASDETRDRIYIQPQYAAPQDEFEKNIFYKVN